MAVKGNAPDAVVVKGYKTIYGIAPFKVVAVNPTMDQLAELGVKVQKEPEYIGEKARIEFWLKSQLPVTEEEKKAKGSTDKSLEELGLSEQMVQKLSIFISDVNKGKADGSTSVWINSFGNFSGVPAGEKPTASWWKNNGEHLAREGEIELIKFLRAWVNAGPGDEVFIDDWDKLMKGNVSELRDVVKTFKDNIVRSMIEVRVTQDGKTYASIYPNHHEPWNVMGLTNWTKEFKTMKKGHFISYQLKEFVHSDPTPTPDPAPANAAGSSEWA